MTNDQEQLITLLFLKYGGWQEVVDAWLYSDESLSPNELEAIDAWLAEEHTTMHLQLVKDSGCRYVTVEIPEDLLDNLEKD